MTGYIQKIEIEQRLAKVGPRTVHYEVAGQGPAVVLIHGLSGSGRWWAYNVPALAQRYRVYNVDVVGFGRSRGQRLVLQEAGSWFVEWLHLAGITKAHLVGHSMGGYIATEVAATASDAVRRLVLVDALVLPMGRGLVWHTLDLARSMRYMCLNFLPVLVGDALRAGPRTMWRAVQEVLRAVSGNYLLPTALKLLHNFTIYVPDFPGFGASEKPHQVLSIAEMAETLRAWMDAMGLERAYLLGNSLGCHTIAVMAARHRARVDGTILVSPVGDPGGRNTLRLVTRAVNDLVREPPTLWAIMFRDFLKAGLRRTMLTLHSLQQDRLEVWLPHVEVPTLVIGGGRDRIVPRWWLNRVADLLPQGRVAVIQDAAHVSNFTHPAQLTALVRAFVENHGMDLSGREKEISK